MLKITTFLILSSLFLTCRNTSRACVPNTRSIVDGKNCQCNNDGQWTGANCNENNHNTDRKQGCQPGQVVFQGCSRCVCKENEMLTCNEESCCPHQQDQNVQESLSSILPWCSPFKTYYINCNLCICPASGKSTEAKCVIDISCKIFNADSKTSDISLIISTCIPKVMYIFPCMHCLCSDKGLLFLDKCVETCVKKDPTELTRRCIPRSLYRKGCKVCRCPDNSFPDDKLCTNSSCTGQYNFSDLLYSPAIFLNCTPNIFTNPRCIYCDCNHDGVIDKRNCLALDCLQSEDIKFNILRETCNPGEMVPFCAECLCSDKGVPNSKYCSKVCSDHGKFNVLYKLINGDLPNIIDKTSLKTPIDNDKCEPNSIYFNLGKYCICPKNGKPNIIFCTGEIMPENKFNKTDGNIILPGEGSACEPGTLVEFDCNTCFCTRNGTFDLKWCTYDDCKSKRQIQELYKFRPKVINSASMNKTCNPGVICRLDCNYCICPDSGNIDGNYCTKNNCEFIGNTSMNNNWTCEPLTYYEMDCNLCFCPRDGLKNVAKCTKNHCENAILRSDGCTPGSLFSDGCNVCICPPNGNKADKACTNYTCNDVAPWKEIYEISQNILGSQVVEDATRNLDICYPGEEFIAGCKLCICPEMGLRFYATCSVSSCDDDPANRSISDFRNNNHPILFQKLNVRRELNCIDVNVTDEEAKMTACTAGSMYIIQCRQCICPYVGDIKQYCRPLPKGVYCEQAFPSINYITMRRKDELIDGANSTLTKPSSGTTNVTHIHTRYECTEDGKVMDNCFICECDNQVLILEHCFKSNSTECDTENIPSFLAD